MPSLDSLKTISLSSSCGVGLDIGSFSVKLVQIKKRAFSKKGVLSFSVVPIKSDGSSAKVVEAIRQACQNLHSEVKKVNISVAGSKVLMRYIILPFMTEADLALSLEIELERYLPFKREDAVIDYRILAKLPNNQMVVLLVGVERSFIEARVNLVKEAGLEPQLINVDAFSLTEAFRTALAASNKTLALLDIGYRLTKLVVMQNNVPYFSRDIETGVADFQAAQPVFNNLINELSLSFEYCERNLEKKVEQIYLSGGGAKNKLLLEALGSIKGVKIQTWDPTAAFEVSTRLSPEEAGDCAALLAVAVGLALS